MVSFDGPEYRIIDWRCSTRRSLSYQIIIKSPPLAYLKEVLVMVGGGETYLKISIGVQDKQVI